MLGRALSTCRSSQRWRGGSTRQVWQWSVRLVQEHDTSVLRAWLNDLAALSHTVLVWKTILPTASVGPGGLGSTATGQRAAL